MIRLSSPLFTTDSGLSRLEMKICNRRVGVRQDKPFNRSDTNTAIIAPPDFRMTPIIQRSSDDLSTYSDHTKSTYLENQGGNLTPGTLPSNISWSQDASDEEQTDERLMLEKVMRRQDTNACIIAPPYFKIENRESPFGGEFTDKQEAEGGKENGGEVDQDQKNPIYKRYLVPITKIRERFYRSRKPAKKDDISNYV